MVILAFMSELLKAHQILVTQGTSNTKNIIMLTTSVPEWRSFGSVDVSSIPLDLVVLLLGLTPKPKRPRYAGDVI
jgi:hypothetical protein